mmetsp:Transcript_96967/g.230626  ORF Transcript_96967/g.230626 Transcript_96967/m.230626 type:complete len:205 (-) Transcript_96967:1847-2461(-)
MPPRTQAQRVCIHLNIKLVRLFTQQLPTMHRLHSRCLAHAALLVPLRHSAEHHRGRKTTPASRRSARNGQTASGLDPTCSAAATAVQTLSHRSSPWCLRRCFHFDEPADTFRQLWPQRSPPQVCSVVLRQFRPRSRRPRCSDCPSTGHSESVGPAPHPTGRASTRSQSLKACRWIAIEGTQLLAYHQYGPRHRAEQRTPEHPAQ